MKVIMDTNLDPPDIDIKTDWPFWIVLTMMIVALIAIGGQLPILNAL